VTPHWGKLGIEYRIIFDNLMMGSTSIIGIFPAISFLIKIAAEISHLNIRFPFCFCRNTTLKQHNYVPKWEIKASFNMTEENHAPKKLDKNQGRINNI
jgi:hypothetical protein